jgi:putative membrane protein
MVRTSLLAAISALALAACGQSTQTAETPPAPEPAAPQQAAITEADFVQLVANSDAFEIQVSQLASDRAARSEVKDFAAMMVRDHTATTQELTALAPTIGLTAPTPVLDSEHQLKLDTLRGLSGAAFDDAYLDRQVEAHEAAISAFQNYIQSASAGPLRDWAQTTLPKLQTHLSSVQSLENAT